MPNDPVDSSVARDQTNVLQPEYIPARILWPALGFPEIVDPSKQDSAGDHTACVHLVLIAAKKDLSAVDVERHLRWATWQQRRTRFLDIGNHSFLAKDISVMPVAFASSESPLTYRILAAAGTIALALAKEVWSTYQAVWGQAIGLTK
jgi:hypothetical protein